MFARRNGKVDALERFHFLSGIAQPYIVEYNFAASVVKHMRARILLLLHVEEVKDAFSRHADAGKGRVEAREMLERRHQAERKVMNSPMVSAPRWASKRAKATTTATPIMVMICVTGVPRPCMTCFFNAR